MTRGRTRLPGGTPASVAGTLNALTAALAGILGPKLVGVYLHGSLTQRAFDPDRSDIDCLVLVLAGPRPERFLPRITTEMVFGALVREVGYLRDEIMGPASKWRGRRFYR